MGGENMKPGYTPIRELMELGRAGGDVGESKAEAMLARPEFKDALDAAKEAAAAANVEPELRDAQPSEVQVVTMIQPAHAAPLAPPVAQAAPVAPAPRPAAGMPVAGAAEPVAPPPDPEAHAPTPRVLVTPRGRGLDEPTDVVRAIGTRRPEAHAEPEPQELPPRQKPASVVGYAVAGVVGVIVGVATTLAFTPGSGGVTPAGSASAAAAAALVCPPPQIVAAPPQACPACPDVCATAPGTAVPVVPADSPPTRPTGGTPRPSSNPAPSASASGRSLF